VSLLPLEQSAAQEMAQSHLDKEKIKGSQARLTQRIAQQ
jgi:hypothetical protein